MIYRSTFYTFLSAILFFVSPSSAAATPQILAVEAAGADLRIELAWPAEAAPGAPRLLVLDPQGREIASSDVWVAPGEIVETMVPGALSAVADGTLQYSLTVVDGDAVLTAPLPFRVRLDCREPQACDFDVMVGVDLDAAVDLDAKLAEALDAAGDEAVDLQVLARKRPELRGAIYTYALALEQAGDLEPEPGDCACAWTAVPEPRAAVCSTVATVLEPDDPLHDDSSASIAIGLEMRLSCARIEATGRPVLASPGGDIVVTLGQLIPCPPGCEGFVVHDLEAANRAEAMATFAAAATATATTTWEVDGNIELQETLGIHIALPETRQADRCEAVSPLSPLTALAPSRAGAVIEASVSADRLNTSAEAAALVRIKNLGLTAWSYAACAIAPEATADVNSWCKDKEIKLLSGDRP